MIERSCDGTAPVARRVDCGPLASHFKEFEALLADRGYASATVQSKPHLLDELSRWLKRRKLQAADLDERRINLFLKHRARRCSTQRGEAFTIGQLLSFLRGLDCIPINSEVVDATPMGRLEQEFARFLSAERGLNMKSWMQSQPKKKPSVATAAGALNGIQPSARLARAKCTKPGGASGVARTIVC
jgi:hypothetical protein